MLIGRIISTWFHLVASFGKLGLGFAMRCERMRGWHKSMLSSNLAWPANITMIARLTRSPNPRSFIKYWNLSV